MQNLTFLELVALCCIVEFHTKNSRSPTERELLSPFGGEHTGLINDMLEKNGILALPLHQRLQYSDKLTSMHTLREILTHLTYAGLIETGKYIPTRKGISVNLRMRNLRDLYHDLKNYPLSLAIGADGRCYLSKSHFAKGNPSDEHV